MISLVSEVSEKPLPISSPVYRHVHDLKSTGARGYIGNRFSLTSLTTLTAVAGVHPWLAGPKPLHSMRTTQTAGFEARSVPASEDSSVPWALGSSGGGRHAGSGERVYSRFTRNPLGGYTSNQCLNGCGHLKRIKFHQRNLSKECALRSPPGRCATEDPKAWSARVLPGDPRRVTMKGAFFQSFPTSLANDYRPGL